MFTKVDARMDGLEGHSAVRSAVIGCYLVSSSQ